MSDSPALDLERLTRAGVYDPAAPNAADRRALVEHLFARGVSQDKIEAVYAARGLTGLIEDLQESADGTTGDLADRFLTPERLSPRDIAAKVGVDVDLVMRVRTELGFTDEGPDGAVIPSTFVEDMTAVVFGAAIFGEASILGMVRVLGSTAARLAEATQSIMFTELATTLMNEPGGELAVLKANQEATDALPLIPAAFTHAFYEHVNRASETMRGGFRDRLDMATVDIAIAFVDLVQSTQWTERVSREEHRAALVEFESQANALAATHWCRLVKTIGDEVMITGFAAAATCRVAQELVRWVSNHDRLPGARGGVSFGTVVPREGDYFGAAVNVAARCVHEAEPGSVLVTQQVLDAATEPIAATAAGEAALRGVAEPAVLFRLT